ncbi:MAG TPA: ABC transporter substrate-binding protein [Chloroflexota bacterium]|nr:ABC transporter substrate-binding protein [Chloroflexota bacterium]
MNTLTRRGFLRASMGWAALTLAACGQAAAPASSAPAASKPAASPSAATQASASAQKLTIKAAWGQQTANQMTWPVAKEAGYFDQYGVNVDLQYVDGSGAGVPALLSGEMDTITLGGSAVVGAQASGSDLVMAAGFVNKGVLRIMGLPEIKGLDDVKGKTIAITKVGQTDYTTWKLVMARQGWKESDLKFVNGNTVAGQVALLQRGDAQATAVSPPNDVLAERAGAHLVLDTQTLNLASQQNGLVISRKVLAAKRPAIVNMIQASIASFVRWEKDPAFIKDVIKKYLKETDQQFVDVGYEAYKTVWPRAPYPSKEGFQAVLDEIATQNPKAKGLTPDQLMDTSLVKELEDSGFIQQIWSS